MRVCHSGIFCLQPATQILPGYMGGDVCREDREAPISLDVPSPIPTFSRFSLGSPVYFHQPELAVVCFCFCFLVGMKSCFFY